jgi:hypothetical protein
MSGRGVARTDCKTAKGRWNPAGRRAHSFRGGRRQSFCRTERQKTIGRINSAPKHSLAGALPKGSEAQKQPHAAGPNQVVIRESCLCNFRLLTFPFLRRGFDGPQPTRRSGPCSTKPRSGRPRGICRGARSHRQKSEGSDYFRKLAARRKTHGGGRPAKKPNSAVSGVASMLVFVLSQALPSVYYVLSHPP